MTGVYKPWQQRVQRYLFYFGFFMQFFIICYYGLSLIKLVSYIYYWLIPQQLKLLRQLVTYMVLELYLMKSSNLTNCLLSHLLNPRVSPTKAACEGDCQAFSSSTSASHTLLAHYLIVQVFGSIGKSTSMICDFMALWNGWNSELRGYQMEIKF